MLWNLKPVKQKGLLFPLNSPTDYGSKLLGPLDPERLVIGSRVDNLTHRHPCIDNLILLAYACKYVYISSIYICMIIYAYTQGFSKSYLVVYLFVFLKIIMFGIPPYFLCGYTTLLPLLTTLVTTVKSSHCHGFRNNPL